jgi:hypothetical protein
MEESNKKIFNYETKIDYSNNIPPRQRNERYPSLNKNYHSFFIAGDKEQFLSHINMNSEPVETSNQNNTKHCLHHMMNTFDYMFDKFKKGLFIQIRNNQLVTFLPFSKINYRNTWGDTLSIDPHFGKKDSEATRFRHMLEYINKGTKFESYDINFQRNFTEWYGNNGLFRFEYPIQEYESGYLMIYDMFQTLVEERNIKDIDLFLNKRDFPLKKKDEKESYENIYSNHQFIEEKYRNKSYLPLLSMNSNHEDFEDIAIPTWEDWRFFEFQRNQKVFLEKKKEYKLYPKKEEFCSDFDTKIPLAVFRGSSTGIGTTSKNNQRLFVCGLSTDKVWNHNENRPLIDAKITSFNLRPRKIKDDPYIRTILQENYKDLLGDPLNYLEQSRYKYILHIPGHSAAYRLSVELSFGSVVLLFPCKTYLWYTPMLVAWKHYVPIEREFDKEHLKERLLWCHHHPEECKMIAQHAKDFSEKYLTSEYALDFLQSLITKLSVEFPLCYGNHVPKREMFLMNQINTHLSCFDQTIIRSLLTNYWLDDFYFFQSFLRKIDNTQELDNFLEQTLVLRDKIKSKNTTIDLHQYKGLSFLVKSVNHNLRRDDLQQLFVGYQFINKLYQKFPQNFVYTLYHIISPSNTKILMEYKPAMTLLEAFSKKLLLLEDMIKLWVEISCLLQIGQDFCGFCHNDLMTWNILVKKTNKEESIYFEEFNIGIRRNFIPVIIDYGASHVVYNNKSIFNSIPFALCKLGDLSFLVFKSIENFFNGMTSEVFIKTNNIEMKQKKMQNLVRKAKLLDNIKSILCFFDPIFDKRKFSFYTVTEYSAKTIHHVNQDLWSLRLFCKQHSRYSTLLENMESYPNKSPLEFVMFLINSKLISSFIFKRVFSPNKYYMNSFDSPYFHFYMRNHTITQLLEKQNNTIIMKNDIERFKKKIQTQLKHFTQLLVEISSDTTNQSFHFVSFFCEFYANQFVKLKTIMEETLNTTIFLEDILLLIQQNKTLEYHEPPQWMNVPEQVINPIFLFYCCSDYECIDEENSTELKNYEYQIHIHFVKNYLRNNSFPYFDYRTRQNMNL